MVDLRAVVKGLGPFFHLEVEVANLGDESLLQIPILLSYNPEKYKSPKPLIQIGALVPGVPSKCIFELECLDVNAVDEEVEIQVLPSQLEDVLRETDRLESDVNFSALVMSRVTMPQSSNGCPCPPNSAASSGRRCDPFSGIVLSVRVLTSSPTNRRPVRSPRALSAYSTNNGSMRSNIISVRMMCFLSPIGGMPSCTRRWSKTRALPIKGWTSKTARSLRPVHLLSSRTTSVAFEW